MQTLNELDLEYIAQYFQALAEPTRLKILNELKKNPCSVGQMATTLNSSNANISKHLSLMAKTGLVSRQSQGNSVIYQISDPTVLDLCELVCGAVGKRLSAQAALLSRWVDVKPMNDEKMLNR